MSTPFRPDRRSTDGPRRPFAWDRSPRRPGYVPNRPELEAVASLVVEALASATPFQLLLLASQIIEGSTPQPTDAPVVRHRRADLLTTLCRDLLATGRPELGALVLAIAAIHADAEMADRLRGAVPERVVHRGPDWLGWIDKIEITDVASNAESLRYGTYAMICWRWPDRVIGTASIHIDHDRGRIVREAWVLNGPLAEMIEIVREDASHRSLVFVADTPADIRALVSGAIARFDERAAVSDASWPAYRPFVEWLIRHLPDDATPHGRTLADGPTTDAEAEAEAREAARDAADIAKIQALLIREKRAEERRRQEWADSPPEVVAAFEQYYSRQEAELIAEVGGRQRYDHLDLVPLRLDPFVVRGPDTARAATDETLALIDRWAPVLFDDEVQAIARMVLSHLSEADPKLVTRSPNATASGILWMVAQRLTSRPSGRRNLGWRADTASAVAAALGVSASTVGKRAKHVLAVLEPVDIAWHEYLHSCRRYRILDIKRCIAEFRRDSRLEDR